MQATKSWINLYSTMSLVLLFFLSISSSYAQSKNYELVNQKPIFQSNYVDNIINKNKDKALLVMYWGLTCKPCLQESKLLAIIADHFKTSLDFIAVQSIEVEAKKDLGPQVVKHHQQLMTRIYDVYGAKSNNLRYFITTASVNEHVVALLKQDPKHAINPDTEYSAIPLFVLFNKQREVVKIWNQSIEGNLELMLSFIDELKKAAQ
jgi:hypothetical protein